MNDPTPSRPPASASADTAANARRFGAYVRWTLYSFALVEAFYLLQIVVGSAYPVSPVMWLGAAAGVLHVVLSVLVCRWAFRQARTPGAWPRPLLGGWVAAGLASMLGFLPWAGPVAAWPVVLPTVALVSATMVSPLLRWRQVVAVVAVVVPLIVACGVLLPMPTQYRAGYVFVGIVGGVGLLLSAWSFAWMLRVLHQLQDAQEAQARLAVADERLRISRDLHDVFGRTLAAISVKSELAAQLVARDRGEEAGRELGEIRQIADSAGKEVRRVVRGEVRVGLAHEIDGARALLGSAGITTTVVGEPSAVSARAGELLGWVVREAATNVLRHSAAGTASIALSLDDGLATLTVTNDGAHLTGTSGTRTGLASMQERLAAGGGDLEVDHAGDWFTVIATAPLGAPAPAAPAAKDPAAKDPAAKDPTPTGADR